MKKLYYSAYAYLAVGLLSGIIFREVTKIAGVPGPTALSKVHTHVLVLGFLMFLLLLLFEKMLDITKADYFSFFFAAYHTGLGITVASMFTRGIVTILEQKGTIALSNGLDAAISGISGLGHVILAIAFVILMNILKQRIQKSSSFES